MTQSSDPRWLTYARTLIGIRETPGPTNNPTIMGWAKRVGAKLLGITYADDSKTPWCGLFVAQVMNEVGIVPPKIAIRASSWDAWGVPVYKPFLGAIVRFQRTGGGHVGIIVGQDTTCYHVLGGNQSNQVSITRIEKTRAVALRWPSEEALPTILAPKARVGGQASKNEA